jgi:hypothetical protein
VSSSLDWMADAACRDHPNPDDFFPSSAGPAAQLQAAKAARVCASCPVQRQCGEHRSNTGATSGVWGGSYHNTKTLGASSGGQQNTAVCGTNAGYQRHYRRGETPCRSCWSAHSRAGAPGGRSKSTGFGGR